VRRLVHAVFFAVLLIPIFGRAARADGKRDLEDGIAFYENLDNDRALERLKAASVAKDLDGASRAKAYLYLGMLQFETGDKGEATKSWKAAFELKKNIEIPSGTSPKTIEAIEAVRGGGGGGGGGGTEPGGAKKPPEGTGNKETPPVGGGSSGSSGSAGSDGAVTQSGGSGGGAKETPALDAKPQPPANNNNLVVQHPPEGDDPLPTYLLIGGAAVVAVAAVVVIVLLAKGGDCKGGGGCLTVQFN
jgi:hypothetical protein